MTKWNKDTNKLSSDDQGWRLLSALKEHTECGMPKFAFLNLFAIAFKKTIFLLTNLNLKLPGVQRILIMSAASISIKEVLQKVTSKNTR